MQSNGVVPDEGFYNILLDGCSKSGNVQLANSVFTDMEKNGV